MKSAWLVAAAVLVPSAVLIAQQNSTAPQPRANALSAVGPAQPKFGRPVPRPDGMLPKVPDGFTVSVYAELQAPRMMVTRRTVICLSVHRPPTALPCSATRTTTGG